MFNEEGNHIDELFRSALKGHQETPPASAWDNIVEKRSFGHILLNQISLNWKNFLFLTFVFATAGIAIVFGTDTTNKDSNVAAKPIPVDKSVEYVNSHLLLASHSPNAGSINGLRQAELNTPQIQKHEFESIIHSNNTIANHTVQINNTILSSQNIARKNNTKSDHLSNQPFEKKESEEQIIHSSITKLDENKKSDRPNALINDNNLLNDGASISNFSNRLKEVVQPINDIESKIELLSSMKVSTLSLLNEKTLALDSNYYKPFEKRKITLKNHLFVNFKIGPEFHQTNYISNNKEYIDYVQARENSTSSKIGSSVQLTLSYYMHNNVFIESGFRYNQIKEEVNYETYTVLSETTVIDSTLLGYKVGPTGEPVPIYDISERTEIEKDITKTNSVNVYHTLSIPVLVGYQLDFNRFSFQLKTGASISLISSRSGSIVGHHENEIIKLGGSSDPYKNAMVYNWELAGSVGYQLSEKVHLIIEPTYRTTLNSLTKTDGSLSEKNKTFGFLTGIRFKL